MQNGLIFIQIANDYKKYVTNTVKTGIISIGIDWGGNGSKHSITATVIPRDFNCIQILESDTMVSTGTNTKQVFRWISNFVEKIIDKYGMPQVIFCDSAEQVLNNSLRTELNYHIPIKDSIKTPIEERIKALIRLLNTDRISFIENQTKTIIEALQTAMYDETSPTDRWIDDGKTSDIDSLDSFVYSWEYYMKNIMSYKGGMYEQSSY